MSFHLKRFYFIFLATASSGCTGGEATDIVKMSGGVTVKQ